MTTSLTIWIMISSIAALNLIAWIISAIIKRKHHPSTIHHKHLIGMTHEWEEFYVPGDTFKTSEYGYEDDDFDDL